MNLVSFCLSLSSLSITFVLIDNGRAKDLAPNNRDVEASAMGPWHLTSLAMVAFGDENIVIVVCVWERKLQKTMCFFGMVLYSQQWIISLAGFEAGVRVAELRRNFTERTKGNCQ